jgi:dihydroorotate dehydrogenase (NAD+) catalytic subunit
MNKLEIKFIDKIIKNPFVLPSGITSAYKKAIEGGVAVITWKSITKEKRLGNPMPRVWKYDCGVINSVGLTNPGIDEGYKEVDQFMKENPEIIMIASLFATKIQDFQELVEKISRVKPHFIELNLSCPNVDDEFGKPVGMEKGAAGEIVKEVKKLVNRVPILAKLSPNVSNIAEIAKACEAGGADGIVAINTVGPGMIIDIKNRKPVLGALKGGVSGSGILPVAVRCVYEIYESVNIPIIGMGGVAKWQDVVEIMMAGATLVGVGTACYSKGFGIYNLLNSEIEKYLQENNFNNISEIIGLAHNA